MKTRYFECHTWFYRSTEEGVFYRSKKIENWTKASINEDYLLFHMEKGRLKEIENPDAPETVIHTPDETQFKSRLGYLQFLFNNSGMRGNPIISDIELRELREGLQKTQGFMKDRGDKSISFCLMMEIQSVEQMIFARKNY